ncbi:MAG: hypothetical protein AB7L70_19155 [Pyrinomonadaceae bacterium]
MDKFKGASGAYLTKQLFLELSSEPSKVLYTLKDEDHRGYPSLRRLYLEMGDETEYEFSKAYFGGWPHWKRLTSAPWFLDFVTQYREELAIRNAAESLLRLRAKAKSGDVATDKYLLEQRWVPSSQKAGRPSKERIKEEAARMAAADKTVSSDLERLISNIGVIS